MAAKKGGAAFVPPEGSEREDLAEEAVDFVFAGNSSGQVDPKHRDAYGPKDMGLPVPPKLSPGEKNDWNCQGYLVQPLPGGFAYPASNTILRRDDYELQDKDNFDPIQALPPRVKKWNGSGR